MSTEKWIAAFALGLYFVYGIAFYAEGHKPQGSIGLKALGFSAEALILTSLAWVVVT